LRLTGGGYQQGVRETDAPAVNVDPAAAPSPAMLAAAQRFKYAWEGERERSFQGDVLSDRDIVEMHEAALGLIWATGTTNSQRALEVLREFDV
jgi:hypothetical protein